MHRKARIERVIVGVLKQAFADAGVARFTMIGSATSNDYAASLCGSAGAQPGTGVTVAGTTKTALLLGTGDLADLLPLGDLFHSQLAELIGDHALPPELTELANAVGGAETLDRVLRRYFDERLDWRRATAGLDARARVLLEQQLEGARFRRGRVGVVAKVGSRTLGIDLNV
jgi:hypothetical protein